MFLVSGRVDSKHEPTVALAIAAVCDDDDDNNDDDRSRHIQVFFEICSTVPRPYLFA